MRTKRQFLSLRLTLAAVVALNSLTGCTQSEIISETHKRADTALFDSSTNTYVSLAKSPKIQSAEVSKYVQAIFRKVGAHTEHEYTQVKIADTPVVNGQSTFDGIFVSRGMLNSAVNEGELAGYLGHELGHLELHHLLLHDQTPTQRAVRSGIFKAQQYLGLGSTATGAVADDADKLLQRKYARDDEEKADEYGAVAAGKAGYDPYALADLFDRLSGLVDKSPTYRLAKLKGTHKALDARAKHLRKFLASKGYKHEGVLASERYVAGLAPLIESASDNRVSKELLTELAAVESEVAFYRVSGEKMPKDRFIAVMRLLRKVGKTASGSRVSLRGLPSGLAFMEEALLQPMPLWNNHAMTGAFSRVNAVLDALSNVKVAIRDGIAGTLKLFESLTGQKWDVPSDPSGGTAPRTEANPPDSKPNVRPPSEPVGPGHTGDVRPDKEPPKPYVTPDSGPSGPTNTVDPVPERNDPGHHTKDGTAEPTPEGNPGLQVGDVDTYGENDGKGKVGDKLTPDHIPSFAAVRAAREQQLGRPLTDEEARDLNRKLATVVIPEDLHKAGRTFGGKNTQQQIEKDAQDLEAAAHKDIAEHLKNAQKYGVNPETIRHAGEKLDELNHKLGIY